MAKAATKKKDQADDDGAAIPAEATTKLRKLIIKNLGCIGPTPVAIDLDEIVVLVGKNNTGKSTILRAYEVLFSSSTPKITIDDFPGGKVIEKALPEIELHTKVENPPASKWIAQIDGEPIVRERWIFQQPGAAAIRQGFDVTAGDWSANVPWGTANVANARRPKPHRIEAFGTPETQIGAVVSLLLAALKDAVKGLPQTEHDKDGKEVKTEFGKLIEDIGLTQKAVVKQAEDRIEAAQTHLTDLIQNVFHGYKIEFDAKAEEDLVSCLNFFKTGASLRMGPADGHLSPAEKQGSGARRTLMWAALKYAAEQKAEGDGRTNLLLMDEPELCLHPNAVREACNTLYNLPGAHNWQVMVTTHSPAFIDLSRDNTTVVRVDRNADGHIITGTTVFRPDVARLSPDEKEELKMLNLCDPSLCEFFFGGRTVIVEGDTEYTAFRYILDKYPNDPKLKNVHIVRARGKSTICLVAKILNQFEARYAILHDSDSPHCIARRKNGDLYERVNSAWTVNTEICEAVEEALAKGRARLVAMIPNFEAAFFGEEVTSEKPMNTWKKLKTSDPLCEKVRDLLYCLLDFDAPVPAECEDWDELEQLATRWKAFATV